MHSADTNRQVAPSGDASGDALACAFGDAWARAGGERLADAANRGILAVFFAGAAWRLWLAGARALLDVAELDRVARKRRPQDGDELALAYGLHRLVLGRILGCAPRDVGLGRDALGRPCLPGERPWTSLSHADGAVAVAACMPGRVGIDIESSARAGQVEEVAAAVLHPAEQAMLEGLHGPRRAEALLALWVRKEALLKAAGIGLAREMHGFLAPEGVPVAMPALDGPDGPNVVLRMIDAGPGWSAAVAGPPALQVHDAWLQPPAP